MCSTLFPCQDPPFPLDWPFITQHVLQTMRQQEVKGTNRMQLERRWSTDMRLDCWWSLMRHLTRNKRATQSETLLHIQPHTYAYYGAFSTYSDIWQWNWKSKVPTPSHARGEERGKELENNSSLSACHPFLFICSPEWATSEKPSCRKSRSSFLSFIYSTFSQSWDFTRNRFSNSKSSRSGNLLWYPNVAEKWQCYKRCSSYVFPCVQLSVSTAWGEKSKCRKLGEWGWRLIINPTGGCSKELRSDTRCAWFVALCFNLA